MLALSRTRSALSTLVDILCAIFIVGAAVLIWQRRSPGAGAAATDTSASALPLPNDSILVPVAVEDTEGNTRDLLGTNLMDPRPTLVFVFRSDCPACAAQKPSWLELAERARTMGLDAVGVTMEPLAPHVADYLSESLVPVVRLQNAMDIADRLYTRVVPATLLVGADRKIALHRAGVLAPADREYLDGFLTSSTRP